MIATAVLSAVLLAALPAPAEGQPRLSISVDNTAAAITGERLTYTVVLRNLGTAAVDGLALTQSVPSGLRFDAAEPSGTADAAAVEWSVDLAAGGEAVFRSTMTVVGDERARVATIACARTVQDGPPLVCASHSARVVAAAADSWVTRNRWYVAAGLLAAAGVALFARRRQSAREEND
ncbi:DUF11 domain-containing protein [Actinokineospora cianjurensis]|uniref:Putative repeat protein (TIGR01451 family) n=1 Tax=Actinokineospora cianjurensis TaxID=585224 RepID=A0A421AYG2_9PSEU|nr:DUF11 domain-containing protein [Actinokineospora cianjurensis]RLK54897.1 putative repeat protein (TIGR01451 family) [Actinokineospora cianjurensis]